MSQSTSSKRPFEPAELLKPAIKLYLIGSLRNPEVPLLAERLRKRGLDIFDDWFAAGPEADDYWQKYEQARGHDYQEALQGYSANHVFEYDDAHLDDSNGGILLLPAGKSGHLELGKLVGQKKPTFIFMPTGEPERWDVMYRYARSLVYTEADLLNEIDNTWPGALT